MFPLLLSALTQVAAYESKSEPDLLSLQVIYKADLIMILWQKYNSIALLSLAASSVTVRREMGIFNNHVVVRIEGKTNEIIQKLTDSALLNTPSDCMLKPLAIRHRSVALPCPSAAKEDRLSAEER